MFQRINPVRYPFWRAIDSDLAICAISTVLLIITLCSKYPAKELSLRMRSQEDDKGGKEFL